MSNVEIEALIDAKPLEELLRVSNKEKFFPASKGWSEERRATFIALIKACWTVDAKERPSAHELLRSFHAFLHDE